MAALVIGMVTGAVAQVHDAMLEGTAVDSTGLVVPGATVDLFDLRIANGLDGKSFFVVTGEVSDVRSAVAAGARQAQEKNQLVRDVVIPRPHVDLVKHL